MRNFRSKWSTCIYQDITEECVNYWEYASLISVWTIHLSQINVTKIICFLYNVAILLCYVDLGEVNLLDLISAHAANLCFATSPPGSERSILHPAQPGLDCARKNRGQGLSVGKHVGELNGQGGCTGSIQKCCLKMWSHSVLVKISIFKTPNN